MGRVIPRESDSATNAESARPGTWGAVDYYAGGACCAPLCRNNWLRRFRWKGKGNDSDSLLAEGQQGSPWPAVANGRDVLPGICIMRSVRLLD